MGEGSPGGWVRAARKLGTSAFLVVHIAATVLWVLPHCPLRTYCFGWVRCYMLPLGLAQYWGMFCPDPPTNALTLEAEVIDGHGLRYNFSFPRQTDYSLWTAIPRHRHPKFAMNLASDEAEIILNRTFAARHVVRQLGLTAGAFPVEVRLAFQGIPCPPPGCRRGEVSTPTLTFAAGVYQFASPAEVWPQ